MGKTKKPKRGYPVALLIGLEESSYTIWKIFSKIIRFERKVSFEKLSKKSKYNIYESIVNNIRTTIKNGTKSLIIVTPLRKNIAKEFISHLNQHHNWLIKGPNKISICQLKGLANDKENIKYLLQNKALKKFIIKTTEEEAENLLLILNKKISSQNSNKDILFSFKEISMKIIKNKNKTNSKIEYLLLTDEYLKNFENKNKINRLLQISNNKKIKTRVISAQSTAGKRLKQLGGLICIIKPSS